MKQKLDVTRFIELMEEHDDSIVLGNYEDKPFAIFDSWEQLESFLAAVNGFEGLKGSKPYLREGETLQQKYLEAKAESDKDPSNWHYKDKKDSALSHFIYSQYLVSNKIDPINLDDFEGLEWGFSDEYSTCAHCYNEIIRISPDSYQWVMPLFIDSEGYICPKCAPNYTDEVKEQCKNEARSLPSEFTPESLGLVKINQDSYQNGLHEGMDDSPKPIIKALNDADVDCWFVVGNSQFYQEFDVYVEVKDAKKATDILKNINTYQGFSNAGNLSKALSSGSVQLKNKEGGINFTNVDVSTGTSTSRVVSAEEFINGIKI